MRRPRLTELADHEPVVTGRGIVSPIGHDLETVARNLRAGTSGISVDPDFVERGFRCHVSGRIRGIEPREHFKVRELKSMSRLSLYSSIAALQAVREAGLGPAELARGETGVVIGTNMGSPETIVKNAGIARVQGSPRRIGSHGMDTSMGSSCSANASVLLGTGGVVEGLSAACATGLSSVGYAARLIRHGYQDTVICGGSEEDGWASAHTFDAMGVLCADSNDEPERASRPLDRSRSGFVHAGGAGVVVLESAARARRRGVRPLARVTGFWSGGDGSRNMFATSKEGQRRSLEAVLRDAEARPDSIDYVNLHATSTPVGDRVELANLAEVLGTEGYLVSSTKSQTGHAIGAAGALELVFCLLMMEHGFVAPAVNFRHLDDDLAHLSELVARETTERTLARVLTSNFGFGGTIAFMILDRIEA